MTSSSPVLPHGTARPDYPRDPLPTWVEGLRDGQVDAVREITASFDDGADVVFLDAPVGSGKTLIGELVRRELGIDDGLYVCSDKALQAQFLRDFPYAKVLMGRANYATASGTRDVTAEDCTSEGREDPCLWCDPTYACPYTVAKTAALSARVAVLNTAYALTTMNYTRTFTGRRLVVVDEADMLEDALLGFTGFEVPGWLGRALRLEYPGKGVHKPTIVAWLHDTAGQVTVHLRRRGQDMDAKDRRKMVAFRDECTRVAGQIQRDVDLARDGGDEAEENAGRWLRDYDTRTFKMVPVMVAGYGSRSLWRHGERWLLMSGTIISADEMADSLGLPLDHATVSIGSTFPVENRKVILAPVANVTRQAGDQDYAALAYAIERICERHQGRVLVHTVSYALTRELMGRVDLGRRCKVSYTAAREKAGAMDTYLRTPGAVMFAPSMDRGVDLAGDKCEVQIIAKSPFPSLGDKRVAARLHLPGGDRWYATKTVRDIVQMTGRGVRNESDRCWTYVLDQQFARNVWGRHKRLFPAYFREAVDQRADVRWLLDAGAATRSKGAA